MRIMILGGAGMLGHQLILSLSKGYNVWATVRTEAGIAPLKPYLNDVTILDSVDALQFGSVSHAVEAAQPDVVINCIGLIKQHESAGDPLLAIDLNARLPHQLARLCRDAGSRLIHISTDCVFLGTKGMYVETDPTDGQDVYGKSKALGEVTAQSHCLTIRASIIGREIFTRYGLLEWFLAQRGSVKGYTRAIFSGFPTYAIADLLREHILPRTELAGLYHVSAAPISKYDLLALFKRAYDRDIEIIPDESVQIDRSLNSGRFRQETGFVPESWERMVAKMAETPLAYEDWKR